MAIIYNGVDLSRLDLSKLATALTIRDWKPIPEGTKVELTFQAGASAGDEASVVVQPDDGYLFDLAYLKLTVPDGVEANVLVTTEAGTNVLFSENLTGPSEVMVDASDFIALGWVQEFELYAKLTSDATADVTVTLEYGGRQVRG